MIYVCIRVVRLTVASTRTFLNSDNPRGQIFQHRQGVQPVQPTKVQNTKTGTFSQLTNLVIFKNRYLLPVCELIKKLANRLQILEHLPSRRAGGRELLSSNMRASTLPGSEVRVSLDVVNSLRERSTLDSGLWGLSRLRGKVSLEVVNSIGERSKLDSRLCGVSQLRIRGQGQPQGREQSRKEVNIRFQTLWCQPVKNQRSRSASRS